MLMVRKSHCITGGSILTADGVEFTFGELAIFLWAAFARLQGVSKVQAECDLV